MPTAKECVVSVEYLGLIRNVLQHSQEQYSLPPGSTIGALLHTVVQRHGKEIGTCILKSDGELRPMTEIYVNGRDVKTLQDLDTVISGESQVFIVVSVNAIPGG